MQNSNYPNGHVPYTNGAPSHAEGSDGYNWLQTPTVAAAMTFTPFSSIVPFNPEVIPPPLATPYYNTNYNLGDHSQSRGVLERLSAGATSAENASKRCQQTIRDVQKLLDPDSLTRYHFKKPRHIQPSNVSTGRPQIPAPALSPFAKMVLDTTDVPFRYLTPESPGTQPTPSVNGKRPSKPKAHKEVLTPQSTIKPPVIESNGFQPSLAPLQDPNAAPSSQTLRAVIPGTLSASEVADIQYIPHSSVQATGSKGSKFVSVAERQKGDAAVTELEQLLGDIFMADDAFDPDATKTMRLLTVAETDDGRVSMLNFETQQRLEAAVKNTAKFTSRLSDIPVEDLLRAQKLNERAVSAASSLRLEIGDGWSQDDVHFWLHKIEQANSGLLAARTLLRIMTAGRQEKELQSEDHVRTVLDLLKTVVDTAIIPIVEERSFVGEKVRGGDKPQHNPKFVLATNYRPQLKALRIAVSNSLRLLAQLLIRVDVDESAISTIVYMCKNLIFAENAAADKDSVLGVQPFEKTRQHAMDVLGRIFARYASQRQFVIDEVLISLEKLPATKQSARQYRLPEGKSIQLVSALLMRLVQTSATWNSTALHLRGQVDDDDEEDADGSDEEMGEESDEEGGLGSAAVKDRGAPRDLASVVKPLYDAAQSDASYIVSTLITRASTTAKSSDEPYRKLMDIFTEDFLAVLGSIEWPAAELLLRSMLIKFISLAEDPKKPVPARNLGLELMATMASGILGLHMQTRSASRNVDAQESMLVKAMVTNFKNADTNGKELDSNDLLRFDGPYQFVIRWLKGQDNDSDAQWQTAQSFLLAQWANELCSVRAASVDSENSEAPDYTKDLKNKLRNTIIDPRWWPQNEQEFESVTAPTARFASLLVTTNLTFCKAFPRLFSALVNSLADEHTQVKARGIKSILTVMERDPDVLAKNNNLLTRIVGCMEDKAPMVRDSALGLIQRLIALRPDLALRVQPYIHKRTADQMPGVRKKAYRVLKDLYLANNGPGKSGIQGDPQLSVRANVANTLIEGMADSDETIVELVRAILEELWFSPFHGLTFHGDNAVQTKLKYRLQAQLLIRCISHAKSGGREVEVCGHMESLVREVLTKSKTAPANERVCKIFIEVLFDGIIDPADIPGTPSSEVILMTLAIFARACPSLMEAAQLERLEPYTNNLNQHDDLDVYRSVLTILRYAMPHVNNLGQNVLTKMQSSLMKSISRLPRPELSGVAACLWTIDGELKNTDRLVNLVASALHNIRSMSSADLTSDPKSVNRVTKLMNVVGQFGKACDFEAQLATFQAKFPQSKSKTVAGMTVEIVCPFTSPKQPLNIREAALDAVCAIAQRWPKMFLRADVGSAFHLILKEKAQSLEEIFVSGLEGFFALLSTPNEAQQGEAAAPVTGRERLAKTYVATDQDGASSELAQKFLTDIVRIAESSADELALTATKLVASILQQGLPHPKECGPTLVALETSPNAMIAHLAWKEHRVMHQKHETTIEKEYVRSIQRSLLYQQTVAGDPSGFIGSPPKAKLHYFWDVLKAGKVKVRHKFIGNIVQKLEFEPTGLDNRSNEPPELTLARYVCENLALFEYDRLDDLLKVLFALEKTFANVGTPVAQFIESEILKLNVAAMLAPDPMAIGTITGETTDVVNPARLKTLALSSQILLVISETRAYILRLWNLQKVARNNKGVAKENSKAPSRATNAPALTDAFIKSIASLMTPADTSEHQHYLCQQFIDVMNVDSEGKAASEDEGDMTLGGGEASGSEGRSATPPAGKGRKRKSVGSMQTTPRKKGRPRKSSVSKTMEGEDAGGWD